MKRCVMLGVLLLGICTMGLAWPQSSTANQSDTSLADYARKQKEQDKSSHLSPNPRVYTNEDVQPLKGDAGVKVADTPQAPKEGAPSAASHGQKYFRTAYAKILAQKELHQRQLEVLQKKLSQQNVQFYPDPNKALKEEYSRDDIKKTQADISAKQQAIQQDDQAVSDLQEQLRRDGGDPGWLREPPSKIEMLSAGAESTTEASEDTNPKDKKKTKEYWQSKFKAARDGVTKAEEVQHLLDDEIAQLKTRQAQEPDANVQAEVAQQLTSHQDELGSATSATEKAKKALADLQKEFDDSGAPADWSQTEPGPSGT
jgi:hypothetical protein